MFEVQHATLREAEREIDRMAARRRHRRPEAERPGRGGLAAWLGRIWSRQTMGLDEPARGAIGDERAA